MMLTSEPLPKSVESSRVLNSRGLDLERLYLGDSKYEWIGIVLESEVSTVDGSVLGQVSSEVPIEVSTDFSYIRTPALGYTAPSG
jgi:hypothetical protein